MELVKKNVAGVDIEYYDIDGEVYMTAKQIGEVLGYKNPRHSIIKITSRRLLRNYKEFRTTAKLQAGDGKHYNTRIFNTYAIGVIVNIADVPATAKIPITELIGTEADMLQERVEHRFIELLQDAFISESPKREMEVGEYRVDLVLTRSGIAVECDEHGHSGYSSKKEFDRESYLKDLGYTVVRFNPHEKGFRFGKVIAEIIEVINTKEETK